MWSILFFFYQGSLSVLNKWFKQIRHPLGPVLRLPTLHPRPSSDLLGWARLFFWSIFLVLQKKSTGVSKDIFNSTGVTLLQVHSSLRKAPSTRCCVRKVCSMLKQDMTGSDIIQRCGPHITSSTTELHSIKSSLLGKTGICMLKQQIRV